MTKQCQECKRALDASSFNGSRKEPDGLAKKCSACVNRRRRQLHASKKGERKPAHLGTLVKKGDYAAVKSNRSLISTNNRDRLLAMAVRDFKSVAKKPSHVELVRFLIQMGARPDFHLVCAATVGPHIDIMNALIEGGAEQNIFTFAALGDVERLRDLLLGDSTLAGKTTDCGLLGEKGMTALDYACRSELGKVNKAHEDRLVLCAEILLGQRPARLDRTVSPLDLCAARGGNVKIAQLLLAHGWQPNVGTVMAALGHGQRHGRGNYDVAALCLESGVDINETLGSRTMLHAFAHQGDIVGTRWLTDHGAEVNVTDVGNNTPLHKACERNSTLKVVELLVERGASLTAVNKNGETALDMAISNDKTSIAAYLRGLGAKPVMVHKEKVPGK
jgi:Ankyrin repeats (3 copies)/Ankyrin repeat